MGARWPALALACLLALPARAGGLQLGAAAPPLVLQTLQGEQVDTRQLQGQVIIVTFWASWCGPCRSELPLLSQYWQAHREQGLQVLGFSLDDASTLAQVRELAAGLGFPVGLLASPWAGDYGRIWHLPVSFVIDRAGRLAYNGWDDQDPAWNQDKLLRVVTPLLSTTARR